MGRGWDGVVMQIGPPLMIHFFKFPFLAATVEIITNDGRVIVVRGL